MRNRTNSYLFITLGIVIILANSCKKDEDPIIKASPIIKAIPIITWANPADITEGTLLSDTQLNASANVAGSLVYTPSIGTSLTIGANQNLKVDFTPTDTIKYNKATSVVIINVIPQMVNIPAGTFTMGSLTDEIDRLSDETQFQVTLSAFRMSKYEITNAQYAAFLNSKSILTNVTWAAAVGGEVLIYASSGYYDWGLHYNTNKWEPVAGYENHPVINVTWYGATEFASYAGGTLPTEAQWEYACRAGTTTPFNTGNFLNDLQANYNWKCPYNGGTNSVNTWLYKTQAVGTYAANAWGLYDMHGNVQEWCNDWYGTYPTTAQTNPIGATSGLNRVVRGGSWRGAADNCRSAIRNYYPPISDGFERGFRIVLVP